MSRAELAITGMDESSWSRAPAVLGVGLVLIGCGSPTATAVGFVTDVDARSLTEVDAFTLRTEEGTTMTFLLGRLELDSGAFPATHLHQHLALAQPIAVAYRVETDGHVAYRLVDAPWAQP